VTNSDGQSDTQSNGFTYDKGQLPLDCQLIEDRNGLNLSKNEASYVGRGLDWSKFTQEFDTDQWTSFTHIRDAGRRLIRLYCKDLSTGTGTAESLVGTIQFENPGNTLDSGCGYFKGVAATKVCIEFKNEKSTSESVSFSKTAISGLPIFMLLRNETTADVNLAQNNLQIQVNPKEPNLYLPLKVPLTKEITLVPSPDDNDLGCSIAVAGALDGAGYSQPCNVAAIGKCSPELTMVQNADAHLNVSLYGTLPWLNDPKKIEWYQSGSLKGEQASNTGFYSVNPSSSNEIPFVAKVTMNNGSQVACGVNLKSNGVPLQINLRLLSDCRLFKAARDYYFPVDSQKNAILAFGNDGVSVQMGDQSVWYARRKTDTTAPSKAEVPVSRGLLNGAMSDEGFITPVGGGKFVLPASISRAYHSAVVSLFEIDNNTVKDVPVYQGIVDYEGKRTLDISKVQLRELSGASSLKPDSLLVAQIFLAKPSITKVVSGQVLIDRELESGGYYKFKPGVAISGVTYGNDYLVPLANESCSPVNYMSWIARSGVRLPTALSGMTICGYSKPFKKDDVKDGAVSLTVVGVLPVSHQHTFPLELLKNSNQSPCVSQAENVKKSCWNLDAQHLPKSLTMDQSKNLGTGQWSQCEIWVDVPYQYAYDCSYTYTGTCQGSTQSCWGCGTKGKRTCCSTRYYSYSCNKTQPKTCYAWATRKEFSRLEPGCALVERGADECSAGVAVRFAGYEQMSLASLGCAVKHDWAGQDVSATLNKQGILPYSEVFGGGKAGGVQDSQPTGYGCIPCRKGPFADGSVAPIPVDQTSSGQPRVPIFNFTKSEAPADCVKTQNVEIRYFGSELCDGKTSTVQSNGYDPQGQYCSSKLVGVTSCQATGGNIAGKYQVDVCPGGGFEMDKIAVSWSPLVLDLIGNGIHVSRTAELSVLFDIHGNHKPVKIDWPMNGQEVAFLVLPNSKGQVTSIRELFGDFEAKNGFDSLAKRIDSNHDQMIDEKDADFRKLRLWSDKNRNGRSDSGELLPLEKYGVKAISLNYEKPRDRGIEGRTLTGSYYNEHQKRFMAVEDLYFYEYRPDGKRIDPKSGKTKRN